MSISNTKNHRNVEKQQLRYESPPFNPPGEEIYMKHEGPTEEKNTIVKRTKKIIEISTRKQCCVVPNISDGVGRCSSNMKRPRQQTTSTRTPLRETQSVPTKALPSHRSLEKSSTVVRSMSELSLQRSPMKHQPLYALPQYYISRQEWHYQRALEAKVFSCDSTMYV